MAPLATIVGALALAASLANGAPLKARDYEVVATAYDMVYVTSYVTVFEGDDVATATAAAAEPNANGGHFRSYGFAHSFGGHSSVSSTAVVAASATSTYEPTVRSTPSFYTRTTKTRTKTMKTSTSAAPSSSVNVAPVESSYTPTSAQTSYEETSAAPVETSTAPATTYVMTSAAAPSSVAVSSAVPTSTSPASSYGSGKRGLAYNDASLTSAFTGSSQVSWAYNWGSSTSGLSSSFEFVPMLWSASSNFVNSWTTNANNALSSGTTHLMSFNEPDLAAQANMSPTDAAAAYKEYMMPFAGKAKLGSPAITNGGGSMGLSWLSSFTSACSDCQIDFTAIHWYDSATNIDYFKSHLQDAYAQTGKPIWLTEFGASGSDAQISSFLDEVLPWMDSQDWIERYAYFMVGSGYLLSGNALSSYGNVYASLAN